jgi:hypothetical protein
VQERGFNVLIFVVTTNLMAKKEVSGAIKEKEVKVVLEKF